MNILVTGGRGFIGTRLLEKLKQDTRIKKADSYDLKDGFDILNKSQFDEFLEKNNYDAIIHLAARTSVEESQHVPSEYELTNVQGSKAVLELAQKYGIKRIVYAATAASLDPESSPYASTKLAAEKIFAQHPGYIALRLFNVVGRRSNPVYCGVIDAFRTGIQNGNITIYGDGLQTRDFIHLDDVCDCFIAACFADKSIHGCFEVGSGKEITINELAKAMIGTKQVSINYKPARKEVRNSVADARMTKEKLGISPQRSISEYFE